MNVRVVTIGGESYIYITDENGVLYKKAIADDETLLFITAADELDIVYTDTDTDEKIKKIVSWKYKEEATS